MDGTTIRGQKSSNSSVPIMFYYDASGKPAWMHYNSNAYYYVYNVQGDVIAIYDNTGTTVVEYVYDAWGNILMTLGSLASTVGAVNPFRYRGYYYDTETGLYYLNSRYYNPEWCRFINADSIIGANGDIISPNLFAYCSNNPVNFSDPSGMCSQCNSATPGTFAYEQMQKAYHSPAEGGSTVFSRSPTLTRDVTKEVNSKLSIYINLIHDLKKFVGGLPLGTQSSGVAGLYKVFNDLVTHGADWDIKREQSWKRTIGTPFPGAGVQVIYNGMLMTPEDLGNYTYGFLGSVFEFPEGMLGIGSLYAAGFPSGGPALQNEFGDWNHIAKGYIHGSFYR